MKTQEHRSYEEKLETRPGGEPSELEELGKVIVFMSLTILVIIGLVILEIFQHI